MGLMCQAPGSGKRPLHSAAPIYATGGVPFVAHVGVSRGLPEGVPRGPKTGRADSEQQQIEGHIHADVVHSKDKCPRRAPHDHLSRLIRRKVQQPAPPPAHVDCELLVRAPSWRQLHPMADLVRIGRGEGRCLSSPDPRCARAALVAPACLLEALDCRRPFQEGGSMRRLNVMGAAATFVFGILAAVPARAFDTAELLSGLP
jgi:hypothetical protein